MILLLLGLQDPTPKQEEPKPPVVRKLRPKQEEKYRVDLTTIGSQIVRYEYDMRMVVMLDKPAETDWPMLVTLENMKNEIAGKVINREKFGAIKLTMPSTGYPSDLTFLAQALPFSIPLLSFYLPEAQTTPLPAKTPLYDGLISMAGTVTSKLGPQFLVQTSGRFYVEGEEKDQSMFRKLNMSATFDPKTGSLLNASGKYTAPDGTVNFRLTKI